MTAAGHPAIPLSQPLIGKEEEAAVLAVLASGHLAQGEVVAEFERAFAALCGTRHAVATSSGTTALHLALLAHGIGPGDEVVTTPFSFVATANCVLHCGARPVFADIEPETFTIDPERVEAAITPRTKAILPVHLFGHPADLDALAEIAARRGVVLIEDAAQAHGALVGGVPVGRRFAGCFSFYPTKNMTAGEGGIVTTDDDDLAARLRLLRSHGSSRRYVHETLGYNFRMTDLHGAIGLAQLPKLPGWNARRRENAAFLSSALAGAVGTPVERPWATPVYHQYTVRVPVGRDHVLDHLTRQGIGAGVYYPVPIHQQPLYRDLGYRDTLPVAERAAAEVLSLPVHPALSTADLDRVAAAVREALRSVA